MSQVSELDENHGEHKKGENKEGCGDVLKRGNGCVDVPMIHLQYLHH